MDLSAYVDRCGRELAALIAADDEDTLALLKRRSAPLESLIRLTLLDVLSTATGEITRDLAPGSVELHLRGTNPEFVVTPPPPEQAPERAADDDIEADIATPPTAAAMNTTYSGMARINFRPPEHLKAMIEEAAGNEGSSVNAWLVRVVTAALRQRERNHQPEQRGKRAPQRRTGWVR